MYVDRHSIELLLKYSAPDASPDDNELRQWLTVLVDRATADAREAFTTAVANGDYPLNAVRAQTMPEGELSLAIDRAPPALLLILGEAVDPDTLDPRNNVPQELEGPLKAVLATWDRTAIEQMLKEEGWKVPVDGPPNTPPDDAPPDLPSQDDDEVVDQGDDTPPIDPDIVDDQDMPEDDPVELEQSSRKKLLVTVGAVVAVGVGFWMWRRRSSGS